jgi:hypothetical protein
LIQPSKRDSGEQRKERWKMAKTRTPRKERNDGEGVESLRMKKEIEELLVFFFTRRRRFSPNCRAEKRRNSCVDKSVCTPCRGESRAAARRIKANCSVASNAT